jgi:hypothetical protein
MRRVPAFYLIETAKLGMQPHIMLPQTFFSSFREVRIGYGC